MSLSYTSIGSKGERVLQEVFKTTEDALRFYKNQMLDYLAPLMQDFVSKQEMMFISTADSHGECDSSFRHGHKGFVQILNEKYLIYPEYKGNGVMASMGNISENPHIGLMFLDFFETKVGLHINGKAFIVKKENIDHTMKALGLERVRVKEDKHNFKIVSYILVEVEEAYIHCSLHIPILKKVDKKKSEKKFSKYSKGGDAFEVLDLPRVWK
jgi:predicted pyridoxine 5'-phosphate oxidase superfamily flavin-nucleotide-binding protein